MSETCPSPTPAQAATCAAALQAMHDRGFPGGERNVLAAVVMLLVAFLAAGPIGDDYQDLLRAITGVIERMATRTDIARQVGQRKPSPRPIPFRVIEGGHHVSPDA